MFKRVKVFSATRAQDREKLGDTITQWLRRERPTIVDREVRLSSDHAFHCLTIVFFLA